MTETIGVHRATEEDVAVVLEIERQCETAPHWAEEEYRNIVNGSSKLRRCLLVVSGGFAVGKVAAGIGELESVAVLPAYRRMGVGEALCRGVIAWCWEQGAEAVELEVRAGSEGARTLYQKLGFREVGRRDRYYDNPVEDAVLMLLEYAKGEHGSGAS